MAKVELLAPLIRKWEGGYSNDPDDAGGATKYGITVATWKQVGYDKNHDGTIDEKDIPLLDPNDFNIVLKKDYWDKWRADEINDQKTANILVDWFWGSGTWGVRIPQRLMGIAEDGVVGDKTIAAVNSQDFLFTSRIYNARVDFFNHICNTNPSQRKFLLGWLNRLNDFK